MECYICKSNSGEKRISPGQTIYQGKYWLVEHAYPVAIKGWLVLVLKRHEEYWHNLTKEEFLELGKLLEATIKILKFEFECEKEYVIGLAEAEHFKHLHLHVIAKLRDLPEEFKGAKIMALLHMEEKDIVPREEIKDICEILAMEFRQVFKKDFAKK